LLLVAYFAALPTALLLAGWLLLLASLATVFALAVIVSRREGIGLLRALVRGVRAAFGWIFGFLP
jgi:hypothetical protein